MAKRNDTSESGHDIDTDEEFKGISIGGPQILMSEIHYDIAELLD